MPTRYFGEPDFPVDALEERVDFVENGCCDFIECIRRDGVGMRDIELREVVEQVAFPKVILVRVVDESTEEVIARGVDVGVQGRLAECSDFRGDIE